MAEHCRPCFRESGDHEKITRALEPVIRSFLQQRDWNCRSTSPWLLLSWRKDRPTPAS